MRAPPFSGALLVNDVVLAQQQQWGLELEAMTTQLGDGWSRKHPRSGEVVTREPWEGECSERRHTMNAQKTLAAVAATLIGLVILGAPVFAATNYLVECPVETTTTEIAKPLKGRKL